MISFAYIKKNNNNNYYYYKINGYRLRLSVSEQALDLVSQGAMNRDFVFW